jgi:hypothetical protein
MMRKICKFYFPKSENTAADLSSVVVELLEERLKAIYTYYQHLNQLAIERNLPGPSTTPSNAAPNRRFVILRTEQGPLRSGSNLNFDGLMLPQNQAYKRSLVLEQLSAIIPSGGRGSVMLPFDEKSFTVLSAGSSFESDRDLASPIGDAGVGIRSKWASGGLLKGIIGNGAGDKGPNFGEGSHVRSKSVSPSRRGAEDGGSQRPPTSTPDLKRLAKQEAAFASTPVLTRPLSVPAFSSNALALGARKHNRNSSFSAGTTLPEDGGDLPSWRSHCFRFSLELVPRQNNAPTAIVLQTPRLPAHAQLLIANKLRRQSIVRAREHQRTASSSSNGSGSPTGAEAYVQFNATSLGSSRHSTVGLAALYDKDSKVPTMASPETTSAYCGRALAEWTLIVGECHMFFERRRYESCPTRWVETPLLTTEGLVRGPRG